MAVNAKRYFPELHIDPFNHTLEQLNPKFVHLEDDLYYQFIPLIEGHISYLGKKEKAYYLVHQSYNLTEDRELDIIIARAKWAAKRSNLL
jgi:hypothetical protein